MLTKSLETQATATKDLTQSETKQGLPPIASFFRPSLHLIQAKRAEAAKRSLTLKPTPSGAPS